MPDSKNVIREDGFTRVGYTFKVTKESPTEDAEVATKKYVDDTSGADTAWGMLHGDIANQEDLQTQFSGKQNSLGFTPEDHANKNDDDTLGGDTPSTSLYPTQRAVKEYADGVGKWEKFTKTHTDFSIADSQSILALGPAEPNTIVDQVFIYIEEGFSDGMGHYPVLQNISVGTGTDQNQDQSDWSLWDNTLGDGGAMDGGPTLFFEAGPANTKPPIANLLGRLTPDGETHFTGGVLMLPTDMSDPDHEKYFITLLSNDVNFNAFTTGRLSVYVHTSKSPITP